MNRTVEGWHFLAVAGVDRRGAPVAVGETAVHVGTVRLRESGYHGSRRIIDALKYAPGPILQRVRGSGDIFEDNDQWVASERTCLAMADATRMLHEFACLCAERALVREREAGRDPDARSWAAVETKRKWLRGEATDRELEAACGAAWEAPSAAAREAARTSVWASAWAAARAAARAAACGAAWEAAREAALEAARASAWAAAREAAWEAAWEAERQWQNETLERMASELLDARGVNARERRNGMAEMTVDDWNAEQYYRVRDERDGLLATVAFLANEFREEADARRDAERDYSRERMRHDDLKRKLDAQYIKRDAVFQIVDDCCNNLELNDTLGTLALNIKGSVERYKEEYSSARLKG